MKKFLNNLFLWFVNIWNINKIIADKNEEIAILKKSDKILNDILLNQQDQLNHIKEQLDFLKSQVFVSVDISFAGYDPTVVCLAYRDKNGENVARFFDFPRGTNLKEVEDYLKHFKKNNIRIDGPSGYRQSMGFWNF